VVSPEQEEVARLQAENQDLKHRCQVAEVREELARTMPYVLRPVGDNCKKGTTPS
jgi:hypothetical protein